MGKLTIALSEGSNRAEAAIYSGDGFNDWIILCSSSTAPKACSNAAKMLRNAARKFDHLALEDEPFKAKVQERINGGRQPE